MNKAANGEIILTNSNEPHQETKVWRAETRNLPRQIHSIRVQGGYQYEGIAIKDSRDPIQLAQ